jgi:hypothetical protein
VDKIKKWNKLTGDGVNEGANLIVGWSNSSNTDSENNSTTSVVTKSTTQSTTRTSTSQTSNQPQVTSQKNAEAGSYKATDGGFFKKSFVKIEGIVSESGNVGVFKSTSGWDDGKYYCLFNKAAAGSIVKIVNPINKKYIYAKVLDVMPDLQQNKDLLIRVSNAAAAQLGTKDENFNAEISY